VGMCCGAVASVRRMVSNKRRTLATAPQHIPTQHDMLPQHIVCKYELKCEYRNITLAKEQSSLMMI